MRRAITAIVATLLLVVCGVAAQQARQQDMDLQAAQRTETVDGDLNLAIKQYGAIVAKYKADHAVSATALVRMAECYQKLGDAQSRSVYERIVREFSDRPNEVALARARLGGAAATTRGKSERVVWTGPHVDSFGRVSSDGRFITYVDWNDGRLMMHDVAANTDRALTPAAPNYSQQAEWSAISRDGKQIVYDWLVDNHSEFRLAALQGNGFVEPRPLNKGYFNSFDWSPDGKWIAGVRGVDGNAEIGLIAVEDGSFRSLKSVDRSVLETARNRTAIRVSPDGKYITYDRAETATTQQRDVFVLAVDGSGEIPAVVNSANDKVIGWSPDGTKLLFGSDRTGSVGLWAVPFANGRAQGPPELLKSDIGLSVPLGVTNSGALYVYKNINARDMTIASIDLGAGKLVGSPVGFTQGFVAGARGSNWSPDGKSLAYPCDSTAICIRSIATGQVHILRTMRSVVDPNWTPDGRSLLTRGTDLKGRNGFFRIDADTGEATALTLLTYNEAGAQAQQSPDGKIKVYFNRAGVFVEKDVASGAEREIHRVTGVRGTGPLSPDGQYFAALRAEPSTKSTSILLIPVTGSEPRELIRLTQPDEFLFGEFTSDSKAVIVAKNTGARRELWLVPITEGRLRKLDIDPDMWMDGSIDNHDVGFSLSPDGRSIAFVMGRSQSEVWALENFLPPLTARK